MVSLLIMHGDVTRFSLSSSICVKDRWKFFFSFYFSPSTRRKEKRVFHFLHVDALLARHIPSLRMTHYQHSLLVFHPSSYAIIFFCFSALLTQRFSSRFFFASFRQLKIVLLRDCVVHIIKWNARHEREQFPANVMTYPSRRVASTHNFHLIKLQIGSSSQNFFFSFFFRHLHNLNIVRGKMERKKLCDFSWARCWEMPESITIPAMCQVEAAERDHNLCSKISKKKCGERERKKN